MPIGAREILMDENALIYFSFANVWEVAIKHAKHMEEIPYSASQFERLCRVSGFLPLKTVTFHAVMVESLVYDRESAPRDHRDPFDRLLLAQAKAEHMFLITHDHLLPYYHESCVISV